MVVIVRQFRNGDGEDYTLVSLRQIEYYLKIPLMDFQNLYGYDRVYIKHKPYKEMKMDVLMILRISLGYEILTTLPPFWVIFLLYRNSRKQKGLVFSRYHVFAVLVFSVYVLGVYHFTGVGTLYDINRWQYIPEQINLIPFSNEIDIVAYILNIVLFVPLGLLAPIIWKKMDKLINVLCAGFGFTLLIEVSQLLNFRSTDIDDVILNVLGAVVGFGVYKLLDKITKSKYWVNSPVTVELAMCILLGFVSRFFLYNEMGLMRLIYGF